MNHKKISSLLAGQKLGVVVAFLTITVLFAISFYDKYAPESRPESATDQSASNSEEVDFAELAKVDITTPEDKWDTEEEVLGDEPAVDDSFAPVKAEVVEEAEPEITPEPQIQPVVPAVIPNEEPPADLTMIIIADAHAGQSYGFARFTRGVKVLSTIKADIAIEVGDFIENRKAYKQIPKQEAQADFKTASQLIVKHFKLFNVLGNHDVLSLSKDDMKKLSGRNNYYSSKINGYNIIVLDANYTDEEKSIDEDYYDKKDKKKLIIYKGTLPQEQLDWFEKQLDKNDKNIVFIHHPFYKLTNSSSVELILKKYQEKVLFSANGHKHPSNLRSNVFGGVTNYEIPSFHHQKSYTVAKITGKKIDIISTPFE